VIPAASPPKIPPPDRSAPTTPASGTGPIGRGVPDFDEVFREHFPRVSRTLRSLGVSDAFVEDATQDVFVIVHNKLPEFEGRSTLATWIYAVTFRVAQNHRRKQRLRMHDPLSGEERDLSADPHERLVGERAAAFVQQFCQSLSEVKRDAFVLCVVENRPVQEVAELLGVSVNTLYSRVRAARGEFRSALERAVSTRRASL
jgi:RNA polymerase sigma-70 factor (ECF subfamily)